MVWVRKSSLRSSSPTACLTLPPLPHLHIVLLASSRHGHTTTLLGSLLWCLITHLEKDFFLHVQSTFSWCSLWCVCLLSAVLLQIWLVEVWFISLLAVLVRGNHPTTGAWLLCQVRGAIAARALLGGCTWFLPALLKPAFLCLKNSSFLLLWETDGMSGMPLRKESVSCWVIAKRLSLFLPPNCRCKNSIPKACKILTVIYC